MELRMIVKILVTLELIGVAAFVYTYWWLHTWSEREHHD